MPTIDIRPLRSNLSNVELANAIRNHASADYTRRIPSATKANILETLNKMWDYQPTRNEFIDALVNKIGQTIVRNIIWTNPLAKFKVGMLTYGDTIEEINFGLLQSHIYSPDKDYLEKDIFGQERPEVQSSFHKVNRQEFYKITINEAMLQRAFLEPQGLSAFINEALEAPTTSDAYDEFLIMTSLFKEYDRAGGFFKVNIPDISDSGSDAADAKYALRRLKEYAGILQFPSRHYNASHMPVVARPDELELFITPEADAALDVEALAGAFNIDKADFAARKTVIPAEYFGIQGVQAILTTKDFFVVADQRIETTSQYNPVGLYTNYFLHHHSVISASRFIPAVLFTTLPGDTIEIFDTPVIDIAALTVANSEGDTVTTLTRGELYTVEGVAVTNPEGGYNDAVMLELVGALSPRTYIAQTGVLHIGPDEDATSLTIRATTVDVNEAGERIVESTSYNVVGDKVNLWPNPEVSDDDDSDGLFEATAVAPTETDDVVTIPEAVGVQYKAARGTSTLNASGNLVTFAGHGLEVGDKVILGAITTTTGVTAGVDYYVKTVPSADTFTLSATPGGAVLALTGNGSTASVTAEVPAGRELPTGAGVTVTAVAEAGYELTPGTTSWPFS